MYVSSRVFTIEYLGTDTLGLVPYADMLNHALNKTISYSYNGKMKGFTMKAT